MEPRLTSVIRSAKIVVTGFRGIPDPRRRQLALTAPKDVSRVSAHLEDSLVHRGCNVDNLLHQGMKVNRRLLPVKAHFFFFMAASGPILPFLTVYGKQLGVSEVLMGSITAAVPLTFLLAKPAFGFIADYFHGQRKLIFMGLISSVAVFYLGLYFVPPVNIELQHLRAETNASEIPFCQEPGVGNSSGAVQCNVTCSPGCRASGVQGSGGLCLRGEGCGEAGVPPRCLEACLLQAAHGGHLLRSFEFYAFVFLMTLSMIAFNVSNSISDAICFDVLGEGGEDKYGYQRVWGTVGFGVAAFFGGLGMDLWSGGDSDVKNYTPAFVLVLFFTCIDLVCCCKLRLPKMTLSENILKDLSKVLKNKNIFTFLIFATLVGILDGFLIFFMFWFLEDLAKSTGDTKHIKVLEGLTVAAETLGGEILFFLLSGKIIKKLGYGHTLTLCFFNYALRLGFISLIPNPWWALPVELLMQGPTYALCYTTIVAYASAIAPPGTSATMQGIVAGMDDGFGYALGSLAGGFLYRAVGGRLAFQVFSLLAVVCCFAHFILYKLLLSKSKDGSTGYKLPGEAFQMVQSNTDNSDRNKNYGINS